MSRTDRKNAMGYKTPTKRPMCSNCKHAVESLSDRFPKDICTWHCSKGEFAVTAQAICVEWSPK